MRDFFNQGLNSASAYSGATCLPSQSGWPTTFQFSNTNGTANASSVVIGTVNWSSNLPSQFSGLFGAGQFCDIYSRANPLNIGEKLTAMNHQQLWFGTIPIFQFAIFYNMDLEINPGQDMTILGQIHVVKNGKLEDGGLKQSC